MNARVVLLGMVLALAGCGEKAGGATEKKQPMAFPVQVQAIEERPVEYAIQAVGGVEAFEAIEITARVAGVVESVKFREGDTVKDGQVLVEIEPARFQLTARQARASLDRVLTQKADAERGLKRREAMSADGVATIEEVEQYRTKLDTSRAEEAQARAALSLAQLNLHDAYVRSPVGGVVEERRVVTGKYVQPGTVLAIIVRKDPLLLRFKVPEHEAVGLKGGMIARFRVRDRTDELAAKIVHVGERADEQGRMVTVISEVQSPPDDLRPGSFAEVTVPLGAPRPSPVIPQTAVRPSEKGFLCYVIEGGVAKERIVQLGLRTADGMVEVRSGLRAGERLVVRGGEALRDGAAVRESAAAPGSAAPGADAPPGKPPTAPASTATPPSTNGHGG
jgi:membrane fusion protein (multidrug efflux system)/multidrug efflux system membrane fusion protein